MEHALVIAGTHSGVGKTSVSMALMAALSRRGLVVQGFKVGPDFIDPGFHTAACGRPSRTLDGWMLDRRTNHRLFARAAARADVAIVEGMMGLFDGASASDESGSTAEMAKWLGLPIVLVVDAAAQARSVAALVHGFETFDPELPVVAVIANRVASDRHYHSIEEAIRSACRAEPVGWLPDDAAVTLPSRHLGLVTAPEVVDADTLNRLVDWLESRVKIERLLALCTRPAPSKHAAQAGEAEWNNGGLRVGPPVRIGVAWDRAFCFYYPENLELLERLGAELVRWSPMSDPLPRGLHGLYFGGGYPELYAEQLTANESARRAIKAFIAAGGVVYAECGGLMYMTEAIVKADGAEHPMVGVFPTRARMHERLVTLGYVEVKGVGGTDDWDALPVGETVRGHEFRYSDIDPVPDVIPRCYELFSPHARREPRREGYVVKNCLASYVHVHFLSNRRWAARWLDRCRRSTVIT